MAYTQLRGQFFKHGGVNYLVMDDNDFMADMLWVKTVDSRRHVCELPLEEVVEALADDLVPRSRQRAA